MTEFIITSEFKIRLASFFIVFIILAIIEIIIPRRKLFYSKAKRWLNNISLIGINTMILRFLFPLLAVNVAYLAMKNGWGLFNILKIPNVFSVILSLFILDFIEYVRHIIFHRAGFLWRVHRVHHTDLDFDLTTGFRFHPIEIAFSMLIKMLAVLTIGAPIVSVIIFEILLNTSLMFSHSNINLPFRLDKLRAFIVTPDMHRVHHSAKPEETNSNFGFIFSVWDKLFKSYKLLPLDGHQLMKIGLNDFQKPAQLNLHNLLLVPFIDKKN